MRSLRLGLQRAGEFAALVKERVELYGHSDSDREKILPAVLHALEASGCCIHGQSELSASQVEVQFDLQVRSAVELYAALMAAGLEMTRESHRAITWLCTVRRYNPRSVRHRRVVWVRLEMQFMDEAEAAVALMPVGLA